MSVTINGDTGVSAVQPGVVAQADLAANVVGNGPAFSAYQSVGQVVSATTQTPVNLVSEQYDYGSNFNLGTSTFVAPITGTYHFEGNVGAPVAATALQLSLAINGSIVKQGGIYIQDSTLGLAAHISADLDLTAGQSVNLYVISRAGTTLTAGSSLTYFQGVLVRAA